MDGSISQAEHPLALDLPAVRQSVTRARQIAAKFAESVGADWPGVELAVGEAVGNVVIHAYREGDVGRVAVSGHVERSDLVISVADQGVGMRPDPGGKGLGFGLPLIAQLCTWVEIVAGQNGGTEVVMRFAIEEAAN